MNVEKTAHLSELDGPNAVYSIDDIADANETLDIVHDAREAARRER